MPTVLQKQAFKKILEKPRPIGTVMREVGYSENTIVDPKNLTESNGWKELMAEYLPDTLLSLRHEQGLDAKDNQGNIDYSVRHKYLDTAYKIKDKYPQKTINAFQFNFGQDQQKFKE